MGEKGAYVATRDGDTSMREAFNVPVVDVTGAGDAFDAAFLACRMRNMDLNGLWSLLMHGCSQHNCSR